ncbi:MAG: tetratricopeptide repeat protein [Treponema sp.]|nr:tetratricopeptide repeat protein [Treponema sp.]
MKNIFLLGLVILFISCVKTPDSETIRLYARASDFYLQGRFAEVSEILSGMNNFPPALILNAKAEYFYGNLDKAEKLCRRAIKLRPSMLEASLYLSRVLRDKNEIAGAMQVIESLLSDNPQDIRTLRFAAELASDMGRFDEAAVFLDRAAEFSAESAMVLLDRARLRWVTGRVEDALEDLNRAKAMLPWDTPLLRSIINLENILNEVM